MRIDAITLRYAITGIFVLAVDYGLLNVLLWSGMALVMATSISFLSGAIVGYVLHRMWTFKYADNSTHVIKFSQFLIVGIVGLLATDLIVYVCTTFFLLYYNVSKTIAVIVSAGWAYIANRWWVFKSVENIPARKRHILVVPPYYPPHMGGLENHAYEFNQHMNRAQWSITVWTARIPRAALPYEIDANDIAIYRYDAAEIIPGFPVPAFWKASFWQQWSSISARGPYSHVLSRTRFFISSIIASIISHATNTTHVHVEHGSYFVSQKNSFVNAVAYIYDIIFGQFVLRSADIVIANSQATASFVSHITHNRITPRVIYRGIEYQDIESTQPALHAINDQNKIIITYAGRLIEGKGVHDLIMAIAQCDGRNNVVCWIIGDGPARSSLISLARKLGVAETIRFFEECDRQRTISLIKASDIIVNPSYTEGLPTVVIEAALCKKAIIATNVGGTREIITHNKSGILITPSNIVELSVALADLIHNSKLRIMLGDRAYQDNRSKFSWEHAIAKYEQALR